MAIDKLAFTPATGWADSDTFKTDPDSESDARAMLQLLHNQTKTYLNNFVDAFEATLAAELGFTAIEGLTAVKVRAALAELLAKFAGYISSDDLETELSDSPDKIPSSKAVSDAMVAGGLGDMLASVYVSGSGKVASAVNADKLGDIDAANYITSTALDTTLAEEIPTKTSDLENDSGFQTTSGETAIWNGLRLYKPANGIICTKAQWQADASNPNRATTLYLSSESLL